ncbi:serine/threonine protein kinase [bacterium]|nr:serine/threonine protein kinase [bacterium]MDY3021304.1 serine/threonine-protein kinase [Oliverpabstia sp.]
MLQIGSVVDGKYKVLNIIGQGGMSVVYLAINERANKTWAIKEIRKEGVQDFTTVKKGLIAEIDILKSLSHKYLPSIVDIIDDGDNFLIVMDYIQGKSLHTILKESMEQEGKPISIEDTISWGKQLCDVLYYLHTRSNPIIYRDMKPANIMLRPNGEIALIDFGTARVFKNGNSEDTTCLGTPGYAAPEQYGGKGQSGPQTDIYCLGATLHHLITGRNPAATPFNFPRITQCRPALLEKSSREWRNTLLGLEMIIEKCTKYEMKDRYQSCAELKYDLEHPEGLGMPYRKMLRNKMIAFGGCAAMAVILGGVSLFGKVMDSNTEKNGFDYYLSKAETSSGTESLEQYRKAIALNPVSEKGYLGLLDTMLQDNEFSTEEDVMINTVLDSKDNGREKDNNTYFKANKSGYIKFSYRLGLAYYYSMGSGGDKASAKGWFRNVIDADMDAVDLGEDNSKKDAWKIRAEVLGKICEYSGKIGVANQAGDEEVSYKDYWNDLISMMDENVADRDNVITELRLYNEIVYQIFSRTTEFRDAGLEQTVLVQVLDDIQGRLLTLNTGKSRQAEDLIITIGENIQMAKRNITSAFAANPLSKNREGDS